MFRFVLKTSLALLVCALIALPYGCKREGSTPHASPTPAASVPLPPQKSLTLARSRAQLKQMVVENAMKPVMGRRASIRDVARVVDELGPIVAEAARQPSVESALRQYASDNGIRVEEARSRWQRLEEADLLLEAGGDPEEVSVANAVGVAQWIAETGKRAGLKIDVKESDRLTALIDPFKVRVKWLEYLAKPGAERTAPGAPPISPQDAATQLADLRAQLEMLRTKRRAIDERYDVRKALFLHARYLLGLYPRFPSMDWVFQAYHGGEAGATRLLKKYLGPKWPGSAAAAIRRGNDGKSLRFADVYFTAKPTSRGEAFSYLYGRGDDHRHYWWKLMAAQRAIALYRGDADTFRTKWEQLLPGRAKEAMWYPTADKAVYMSDADVQTAVKRGALVAVRPSVDAILSSGSGALRPEAKGLLRLIVAAYRKVGGKAPLQLGDQTVSGQTLSLGPASPKPGPLLPPNPLLTSLPGGGPPGDFNFHATGLAFDILRPADDKQRKLLEYAIGYFQDRQVLWHMEEQPGPRRYHIVPHPQYAAALASIARGAKLPALPGL